MATFLFNLLVSSVIPNASQPIICRNIVPKMISASDIKENVRFTMYGSLSNNDQDVYFTYKKDKQRKSHGTMTGMNGAEEATIEMEFLDKYSLVAYIDTTNKIPLLVKFLFFNEGENINYCLYTCATKNPDSFEGANLCYIEREKKSY